MSKQIFLLMLIITLNTTCILNAQIVLKGQVVDNKTKGAIQFANVVLLNNANNQITQNQTNAKGYFQLTTDFEGEGILRINLIGYKQIDKKIKINKKDIDFKTILIEETYKELREVQIKEKQPIAIQKGDTTELKAESFKANPDASAQDIMEKMPGISLKEGKLQAHGEEVKKVLIDGKESFADDVNATIQNLPADMIEKIQIFDKLSDRAEFTGFDDGDRNKTINIITKHGMLQTVIGKMYVGYGSNDRYQAGANINMTDGDKRITILFQTNNTNQQNFSIADIIGNTGMRGTKGSRGGNFRTRPPQSNPNDFIISDNKGVTKTNALGLNYSNNFNNKVKLTASYFLNISDNVTEKQTYREYISEEIYNESNMAETENINHRINTRIEWQIDTSNSLLIIPRLTLQQNKPISNYKGYTSKENIMINDISNDYNSKYDALNLSNNILFRHKLAKIGRTITLGVNGQYSDNQGEGTLNSYNIYNSNFVTIEELLQNDIQEQYNKGIDATIAYTEPFTKNGLIMADYQTGYRKNTSNKHTYSRDNVQLAYTLDSSLSNKLENDYLTNNAGLSYMFNDTNNNLVVKINYQMSDLQNEDMFFKDKYVQKTFHNILPSLMYRYRNSKRKSIQINYRTSVNAPSIQQLQEVPDNTNPTQITKGNSLLTTDYQHNMFARYFNTNIDKGETFFALIGGGFSNNYIGNNTFMANKDTMVNNISLMAGSQLSSYTNMSGYYNLRSMISYGIPIALIKSNFMINFNANYSQTPGIINGEKNYVYKPTIGGGITISSNISKEIDFTISSNANYNIIKNKLKKQTDYSYYNYFNRLRFNWIIGKSFVFQTDINQIINTGLSEGYNLQTIAINTAFGYKFLKNKRAEIKLSVSDLLNQNKSISRNSTELYIEDIQTNILERYYMLTFIYNIRKMPERRMPESNFRGFR